MTSSVSPAATAPVLSAAEIIARLGLEPHPKEGGYFRETWRAAGAVRLGPPHDGMRSHGTAIYYLLTPDTFSHLHRLHSDEVFHFYFGDAVEMLHLPPDGPTAGTAARVVLGHDLAGGQVPQVTVPAGVWQGARLSPGGRLALLGCTVAPGFAYEDYEHADRAALMAAWPAWSEMITALTAP